MMLVVGEMHLVTFIFAVTELLMFIFLLPGYLNRPQDKRLLWFLILLALLITYNITGGLFPDPGIKAIPVYVQTIIAYGSGFLMASYFPFYFYKAFDLKLLRFHALYGVPLFLILPFFIFFVVSYSFHKDLDFAIRYGIVVPFFYSFVLLWAILRAIRSAYREHRDRNFYLEEIMVYGAVTPWATLTSIVYFGFSQLTEALFTNLGFLAVTGMYSYRSIVQSRAELRELTGLKQIGGSHSPYFEGNCILYGLTQREIEITNLIRQGMRNREIADSLHIAESTVKKHIENMFQKTGAGSRMELVHLLIHTSGNGK